MIPYSMLYTIAAGVPILLAALALSRVLRRYGRPERGVWLGALVLALVAPALALLDPVGGPAAPATTAPAVGVIGLPEFVVVPERASTFDLAQFVLLAWVAASGVLAIRWAIAAYRLSVASRSWTPGTLDGVSVWLTDDVGPAVSGVFRPRVLAPEWLRTLPGHQRSLVLLHEQEHVLARDPLLVAGARVARILTPWNPVVWVLTSRLVRAIELDCDRRVLSRTSDVATYGQTLLTVSGRRPGRLVAAAAFAESEAPLRTRILAMTTPARSISILTVAGTTTLTLLLLAGACAMPIPAEFDVQASADTPPPVQGGIEPQVADGFVVRRSPDGTPTLQRLRDGVPVGQPVEVDPDSVSYVDSRGNVRRGWPPAPAPATTQVPSVVLSSIPGPDLAMPEPATAPAAPVAQQVPEPEFSPMTVRPVLTNADVVREVLLREYPAVLRDAGVGGAPVLWLYIGRSGSVDATRVYQTSGFEALDQAAQNVARAMEFSPAQNGDEVVAVWVQIPIRFAVAN